MTKRFLAFVAFLALGCAAGPAPAPYDRALGLESFEAAWRIVYETHFDTTFNGIDWSAVREELRPRAAAATNRAQLRSVIRAMVNRLGQSHFAVFPAEYVDDDDDGDVESDPRGDGDDARRVGDVGIDVRLVDGAVVVVVTDSGGPGWSAGVRQGWVVEAVDAKRTADLIADLRETESRLGIAYRVWRGVVGRLNGLPGDTVAVEFLDGHDRSVTLRLARRAQPGEPVKFGDLPTIHSRFAGYRGSGPHDVEVGVIWFNFWMVPLIQQVDSAVNVYRALNGMVIDLRGNPGGVGAMVMGVAGHFFDERVSLGTFATRTTRLSIAANPRRVDQRARPVRPFDGPVAILIDETSGSASEVFAGGMQAVGRARVFGATSMGAVLPARTTRLPHGDVLYHAFAEFTTADGIRLEGRGVIPDQQVVPTRGDYVAGRDPALAAALAWIAEQRAAATNHESSTGRN